MRMIINPRSAAKVLLCGLNAFVLCGCGVLHPAPKSLYPEGPDLTLDNAAVVNLMAYLDAAWAQHTEIEPQFPAAEFGESELPSTWVVLMPAGDYLFRFRHPCLMKGVEMPIDNGTVTVSWPVWVEVRVTLAAGRFYRVRYSESAGPQDFEVYETTEDDARRLAMERSPSC